MQTERIILRPWRDSDAETLYKWASDPDVGPHAGWPPHQSVEESLKIIQTVFHNDHTWAIELKETGEAIGAMGYYLHGESNIEIGENDAEVGYWVAKPYWNQGICTEALQLMIDWCFTKKHFEVLWSDFFTDNPASGRVMEKCGFRDTGKINYCSHLYHAQDRPVHIMRLDNQALPAEGRYFRHFKGGLYRYVCSAFDSETQERMVVYQALYGDRQFWVRPEKMFFESVTRDGKTFPRFTEIDREDI